jgi:hypothetical protein
MIHENNSVASESENTTREYLFVIFPWDCILESIIESCAQMIKIMQCYHSSTTQRVKVDASLGTFEHILWPFDALN